jgi:kynurenine formamidase
MFLALNNPQSKIDTAWDFGRADAVERAIGLANDGVLFKSIKWSREFGTHSKAAFDAYKIQAVKAGLIKCLAA